MCMYPSLRDNIIVKRLRKLEQNPYLPVLHVIFFLFQEFFVLEQDQLPVRLLKIVNTTWLIKLKLNWGHTITSDVDMMIFG